MSDFHNDHRCWCGAYGSHGMMSADTRIHEIEWRCEDHKGYSRASLQTDATLHGTELLVSKSTG